MKVSLLYLALLLGSLVLPAQVVQEQVIPGELPDPSVIEVDGAYYATGSSNDWGPVYPVYHSTDLKEWTLVTYVFDAQPEWTMSSYWAPELYYADGTFYCYYTAKRTDGTSMLGVATTTDITRGFTDRGQLLEWGEEAIDAFVYREGEQLYLTWKAYGLTPDKPIQLLGARLSDDGLAVVGDAFPILTADAENWERGGIEGQSILEHDGYLYLLYSGNACCGGGCDYQVGVARAQTMAGPWEKYAQNPLLVSNDRWKCPGHGTALRTNDRWYYLYHAYPAAGFPYLGRTVLLSELEWTDDGWPAFRTGPGAEASALLPVPFADDFSGTELGDAWRYDVASYAFDARVADGRLTLTEATPADKPAGGAMVGINPDAADFTMTTEVDGGGNALAGLSLYATGDNSLGIGVTGDAVVLWEVRDGSFSELNRLPLAGAGNTLLRARVTDAHRVAFAFSTDGSQWQDVPNAVAGTPSVDGTQLAWWSWGIKAGLSVRSAPEGGDATGVFGFFEVQYE